MKLSYKYSHNEHASSPQKSENLRGAFITAGKTLNFKSVKMGQKAGLWNTYIIQHTFEIKQNALFSTVFMHRSIANKFCHNSAHITHVATHNSVQTEDK